MHLLKSIKMGKYYEKDAPANFTLKTKSFYKA